MLNSFSMISEQGKLKTHEYFNILELEYLFFKKH